ncbi:hypothetical protein [Mammaliicoccus lentus]|nr:hypothetical protein [Mammaliicoccus lentus]WHI55258.1 hypothetical protein PYH59_02670 [Mammaliicoccus lentus]WHI57780.1 hypothetical protein PYH49_02670 [Mammaliicoccus lentus]WHI65628.1 hypothetical protein PYH50_02680 [Mammaliicoccus lentus]WHI86518.1 hypothetical protein PYH60_02675 [Mammaliicoccus lentus]WHI91028.1 hypothetical protein PYH61_02665 [Mammaliicoccus lentus]
MTNSEQNPFQESTIHEENNEILIIKHLLMMMNVYSGCSYI